MSDYEPISTSKTLTPKEFTDPKTFEEKSGTTIYGKRQEWNKKGEFGTNTTWQRQLKLSNPTLDKFEPRTDPKGFDYFSKEELEQKELKRKSLLVTKPIPLKEENPDRFEPNGDKEINQIIKKIKAVPK